MKLIFIFLSLIIIFCTLLIGGTGICYHVTDKGKKIGTVIKLSQSGVFVKTWEAEMIKGGMNGGSGAFGVKPFFFTVRDLNLLPAIEASFNSQKEIVLSYHEELACLWDSEAINKDEGACYYVDAVTNR